MRPSTIPGHYANLLIAAALALAATVGWTAEAATVSRFSPQGPEGGGVRSLAVDPSRPDVVYAATTATIYKSTDGGRSWSPRQGLSVISELVQVVVVDPTSPQTLYAGAGVVNPLGDPFGGGLAKSIDGGDTWAASSTGLGPGSFDIPAVQALLIDPSSPQTVYAGTSEGLFRSEDGGATWSIRGLPGNVLALASDPADPQRLFAGRAFDFARSEDGGFSWQSATSGLPRGGVRAVAVAEGPERVVLAGTAEGVFRSTDGGDSWAATSGLLAPIHALTAPPSSPGVVYAASELGLFRSLDAGASFAPVDSGLGAAHGFRSVEVAPSDPRIVFAGAAIEGVYRSANSGQSWKERNGGLFATGVLTVALDPENPSTVYAGTRVGLFRRAAGDDWVPANQGLSRDGGAPPEVSVLVFDPITPDTVYAGTNAGLFKSTDRTASWQPSDEGLPAGFGPPPVFAIAVDPTSPETVYAGTGQGVFRSDDRAASWQGINQGITGPFGVPGNAISTLALDPRDPLTLYAGGFDALYKSSDGGDSWRRSDAGITGLLGFFFFVNVVRIDPDDPSVLYAGTSNGLFRSDDAGSSWSPRRSGLGNVFFAPSVSDLLIDPQDSGTLFLASSSGLFQSNDGSDTWQPASSGLPLTPFGSAPAVEALALEPSDPAILWAGTSATGVYAAPLLEPEPLFLNDSRFRVELTWRTPNGVPGVGHPVAITGDTGYFWFLDPANVEVAIKVLDGTGINGHFWVFYGALSDLEYHLTITDTATGIVNSYTNPAGQLASFADTSAFPGLVPFGGRHRAERTGDAAPPSLRTVGDRPAFREAAVRDEKSGCEETSAEICLTAERFRLRVTWTDFDGQSDVATAVPLTADTGYFWFLDPDNIELVVKVLDARSVNGHFWVFYGALTNVGYEIEVTDTATGEVKRYVNEVGELASGADTAAF